jgi:hypothetical protein
MEGGGLELEEMIATDVAKGKAALGNGITWKQEDRECGPQKDRGLVTTIGGGGGGAVYSL